MSTPESTDTYLVNRGGQSFYVTQENIMGTLQDDDLLLVNRGGQSFKITGLDFKNSIGPSEVPPIINNLIVGPSSPGSNRFTSETFPVTFDMALEGIPVSDKQLKVAVSGSLSVPGETSPIQSVNGNVLTFEDDQDLDNGAFVVGNEIISSSGSAGTGNTVVGLDAAANQMTVSGGTWNTGDRVINTVINPITIEPVTSDIISIGSANSVQGVFIYQAPSNKLDNKPPFGTCMDKGDAVTNWNNWTLEYEQTVVGATNGTIGKWFSNDLVNWTRQGSDNWNNPTPNIGLNDHRYMAVSSASFGGTIPKTGVITGYVNFVSSTGGGTADPTAGLNLIPIENVPKLNFADDKDLANFADGLAIHQDAPVTPITSDIVTVGTGQELINEANVTLTGTGWVTNDDFWYQDTTNDDPGIFTWTSQTVGHVFQLYVSNTSYYNTLYVVGDFEGSPKTIINPLAPGGTGTATPQNYYGFDLVITAANGSFSVTPIGDFAQFMFMRLQKIRTVQADPQPGRNIIPYLPNSLLTFQDNTQLGNFRAGDYALSAQATLLVTSGGQDLECKLADNAGTIVRAPEDSVYDVTEFTHTWTFLTPGGATITPSPNISGCDYLIVSTTGGLSTTTASSGTIGASGEQAFPISIPQVGGTISIKFTFAQPITNGAHIIYYANGGNVSKNNINGAGMNWGGTGDNTTVATNIEGAQSGVVTVTSVDAGSNQMTVGGTWTTGEKVMGNTIAGSGICLSADDAARTMNVDSRYAVGSKVMGASTPLIDSTLYAVISNTGAVSDLQKSDPGFVTMQTTSTSQSVSWPATLPSGQDPDTEFPAGTEMKVTGNAFNPSGSSTKSDTVTPT